MKTIADHMIDVLKENKCSCVWMGDCDLIEECASRANVKGEHPLKRYKNVLAALGRSNKFEKGYLTACNVTGKGERNVRFRCFKVKKELFSE